MRTREEVLEYTAPFPDVIRETPFRDPGIQLLRILPGRRTFLWIYEKDSMVRLDLKGEPDENYFLRKTFPAIRPAARRDPSRWNTIILDGTVPEEEVKRLIRGSYMLVSDSPTKRIYEAVRKIQKGKVATYGQVAAMAGNPRMSRAVGNALHKNPDPEHIPCHRVLNAKGELADEFVFGGAGVQQSRLEAEGVVVKDGRVDLEKYAMPDIK